MIDDATFFAWLDGELDPSEADRVEAAVAADPALARRAAEHRAMQARLRAAFDPIADAPLPGRLADAVPGGEQRVVSFADARARRDARASLPMWRQAAAMAATLVVGIAVGNMVVPQGGSSPIAPEAGRLVASAGLENALYAQLASAPAGDEGPRIGLTFRDRQGSICRTFEDQSAQGLACHEGGDWRIRALFQGSDSPTGEYRMAAGADPRLLEIVDETIHGEPFDAARERDAQKRGWR
jgi:hypothetical protein